MAKTGAVGGGTTKVLEGFKCAMICAILDGGGRVATGEVAMREVYMQVQIDGTFVLSDCVQCDICGI
jgi:hypothetical protein